jgi:adenosylcobinamide-GDP ribazoletransferase
VLFDHVASSLWSIPVASLLDVIFLAILTGAFHLDGLGDSADGLLGQRSKEKTLSIMKDSRLGTMGLVAIVFGLALKWAGITGLDANRALLLVIVPAYARAGMLCGMRFLEYGRPDGGTGVDFFKSKPAWTAFWLNLSFCCLKARGPVRFLPSLSLQSFPNWPKTSI